MRKKRPTTGKGRAEERPIRNAPITDVIKKYASERNNSSDVVSFKGQIEIFVDGQVRGEKEQPGKRGDIFIGEKADVSHPDYLILFHRASGNCNSDNRLETVSYVLWRNIRNIKFYFPAGA